MAFSLSSIKAFIFDLDGTLVDTNGAHAKAWQQSFETEGFEVSVERINAEIGKGGDHLVGDILGAENDQKYGEKLRQGHTKRFLAAMKSGPTMVFENAKELVEHIRKSGLKVALASSSQERELKAVEKSCGVAWRELFDVVVTGSDVDASKPSPDSVVVAVQKLGLTPEQCVFVGDTIYDAQASGDAGVSMLGVRTGPFPTTADARLLEAGARRTYEDTADLMAHFEEAIKLVSLENVD